MHMHVFRIARRVARRRGPARHRPPTVLLALALGCAACGARPVAPQEQVPEPPPATRKLVWSDEFDAGSLPDTTRWYCEWGPNWYNGELQYYTSCRSEHVR